MRRGHKSGRATLVVYAVIMDSPARRAGVIVSRIVGGAVLRNRTKRRIRALLARLLPSLPEGTALVVRALPPAGSAATEILEAELASATAAALRKATA